MKTTTTPCSMCHFCVRTETENHGSVCIWYNTFITQDEIHDVTPLRETCYNDPEGDNFVWKLIGVTPIEYVKWKQSISLMLPSNRRANIAIWISIISVFLSLVVKYIK